MSYEYDMKQAIAEVEHEKITMSDIIRLASEAAVLQWGEAHRKLEDDPDNLVFKYRERKAWNFLEQLQAMERTGELKISIR